MVEDYKIFMCQAPRPIVCNYGSKVCVYKNTDGRGDWKEVIYCSRVDCPVSVPTEIKIITEED